MDTCTSDAQRRVDRAIGPYDYVSSGETSEKVVCSIGSAWVGVGAVFDGHKISFSLGPGCPVLSRRIARRISSLIWVVLGERLTVVEGNCLQEGEESECLMVQREFQGGG